MIMTHKQHLRAFMLEYLAFAEGKGNPTKYSPENGICVELHQYVRKLYHAGELPRTFPTIDGMTGILEAEFAVLGLDEVCPFGTTNYSIRAAQRTQHECPIRLAFIRDYLSKTELENV